MKMAIFHFSAQMISRSSGRSAVASSAYRSCDKLEDQRTGLTHDYSKKQDLVHSEIMLPENAPEEFKDRSKLWNAVESSETRVNSQVAREINVALPKELNLEEQKTLLQGYIKENFVNQGMCADFVIHNPSKKDKIENPHAHIMLTTREVDLTGFTKKNRDWNSRDLVTKWRENWAKNTNLALEKKGLDIKIDHRSYEAQGIGKIPSIHLGVTANAMEKRGIQTDRGNINRAIQKDNQKIRKITQEIKKTTQEIKNKTLDILYKPDAEIFEKYKKQINELVQIESKIQKNIEIKFSNLEKNRKNISVAENQKNNILYDVQNYQNEKKSYQQLKADLKKEMEKPFFKKSKKMIDSIQSEIKTKQSLIQKTEKEFQSSYKISINEPRAIQDRIEKLDFRIYKLEKINETHLKACDKANLPLENMKNQLMDSIIERNQLIEIRDNSSDLKEKMKNYQNLTFSNSSVNMYDIGKNLKNKPTKKQLDKILDKLKKCDKKAYIRFEEYVKNISVKTITKTKNIKLSR